VRARTELKFEKLAGASLATATLCGV